MRVPLWVPRTLMGYAACATVGLVIFGVVALIAFDGRVLSNVPCTVRSCFQSRNLEVATAFAAALVSGTWIGTRLESVWLRVQNDRGLALAHRTEATFYGPSSEGVAAFIDSIPTFLTSEKMIALTNITDSDAATVEAMTTALRSAFVSGQAQALDLFVQRAQVAAHVKLVQSAGVNQGRVVQSILRAVALIVVKDYLSWGEFMKAYGQYAPLFGNPKTQGPASWQVR